jgi:hypothetical protein
MRTPTESSFFLSKVKVIANGGLDVHFEVEETCGQEIYRENYHLASSKGIHPDLQKLFDSLKPIMARVYHLSFFKTILETPEFKATKAQKEIADAAFKELLNKIKVTGVSLSGKDDNVGVVLTGTFTADSNQKMAINSHRMKFSEERYGFEEEMEQIVSDIESEVYKFLFKNKRAQLELFDEHGEPYGTQEFNGEEPEGEENGEDDGM